MSGSLLLRGGSFQCSEKGNLGLSKPQALHSEPLPVPLRAPPCLMAAARSFTEERMQIATDRRMCPMRWQEGGASFELQREELPDARELNLLSGVQCI